MAAIPFDPLAMTQALIRCPSVTPADAGALDLVTGWLQSLGFACQRLRFGDVDNLYARIGDAHPVFCFAGHTDVVPVGDPAAWTVDPFGATVLTDPTHGDRLYGRGAADMKGAVAAFIAATARYLQDQGRPPGSIALLLTGDEEGPATDGTVKVLDWLRHQGQSLDACLVGEPTNPLHLGDMAKIGRRGSLNAVLTAIGVQGHVAYPHLADNPLPRLAQAAAALAEWVLDDGSDHFQPSTLAITSIDVGNPATNVIPARGTLRFNIRFNDRHTPQSLEQGVQAVLNRIGGQWDLRLTVSGIAFLTPPGPLSDILCRSVQAVTGQTPQLSTSGGTSDARFIKDFCPVIEFGLVGQTMHKADEQVAVVDLYRLTDIYLGVLKRYFAG